MSIKRNVIQKLDIPNLPGWQNQLILLEFAPGAAATPHTHPVSGISFVVKGRILSHYEGEEEREYREGQSFIDPANVLHIKGANASSTEELHVLVSYVVEKGHATAIPA